MRGELLSVKMLSLMRGDSLILLSVIGIFALFRQLLVRGGGVWPPYVHGAQTLYEPTIFNEPAYFGILIPC